MSASGSMSHDEAISQFCGVTGADEERARALLEACEWNLELAINMHVDTDPEGRSNKAAQKQSTSSAGASSSAGPSISRPVGTRRMVLLDDNDGDDEDSPNVEGHEINSRHRRFVSRSNPPIEAIRRFQAGTSSAESSAAGTAETANAYSNLMQDSDGVRPPIAPVRQILNPNPIGYPSPDLPNRRYNTRATDFSPNVFDAFRDFQAEAQWQEMMQEGEAEANGTESRRTLQSLFRPPLELMYRGAFTNARETGTTQNKWLLVNIQNGREFACQVLNRDVWSHQTVKDIIKEHFIFWQVYHDSYEGQRYTQFYHVTKLPHVAIIDPRTGEQMLSWPTSIDQTSFCDSVIEFLTDHPSPDGTASDANTMKKLRVKEGDSEDIQQDDEPEVIVPRATLYDQSEEAQLEAAIRASLQEPEKKTLNDTIELDDDTMEASDISEPELLPPRDQGQVGKSPIPENNSKSKETNNFKTNQNFFRSEKPFESHEKLTNSNSNNKTTDDQPDVTAADALKAVVAGKPDKIEGPECKIALRFPDGSSHIQKFSASERLKDVKKFVQLGKSIFKFSEIEFVAPPNRKLSESKMGETLEDLGLCPASRLEVKFAQD